jgi:hypothetical protein
MSFMVNNDNIKHSKILQKFICEKCDFKCSNKQDYTRHLSTLKHKRIIHGNNNPSKTSKSNICLCGKTYKHISGLSRHKKICNGIEKKKEVHHESNETNTPGFEIDKEMLIKMLLKNQEVMEKMIEIMPNIGSNNHITNTTNSHNTTNNNQFNIQMFLNDRCKNAMNLTDFIDTLPITAETYDSTIDNGLTKTITNMITNGLSQLDVLERPIHCTDASRKTLYVKEDNVWEKDHELVRILLGIRQIASKQRILINKWKDAHDDWNSNDRMQSRFTSLICNSITDIENEEKETNKIIRSISKMVYLDSDMKNQYLE